MPINQPMTQVRLTNVSVVRMRRGKKRFEIACYQNKIQDWRSNVEKDIDEVLQLPSIFLNVSKGQVAPTEELKKAFGHADVNKIALDILNNGEIQLSEKERQAKASQITNEIYQIVSTKCVNPKTKKRYPPTMIQKALNELNFNPVSNKPAKIQALEAIKLLTQKQLIPISRAKMKLKVTMEATEARELKQHFARIFNQVEKETWDDNWECIAFIDPVNYRQIVETMAHSKAKSHIEVLDMAVIKEGDSEF